MAQFDPQPLCECCVRLAMWHQNPPPPGIPTPQEIELGLGNFGIANLGRGILKHHVNSTALMTSAKTCPFCHIFSSKILEQRIALDPEAELEIRLEDWSGGTTRVIELTQERGRALPGHIYLKSQIISGSGQYSLSSSSLRLYFRVVAASIRRKFPVKKLLGVP
jgi:hypothetical protein